MISNCNDKKVPAAILLEFKRLQPEIISLLSNAPKFGSSSLELHYMDGVIKRIVLHREESIIFSKEKEDG